MQRFFFAQKAFIIHDEQVLLLQKSRDDPNVPGKWEVPGGRMEFGESLDRQIIREVREEVGIDIAPGPPFFLWEWKLERPNSSGETIQMHIVAAARLCRALTTLISTRSQMIDDYIAEARWVRFDEVFSYGLVDNMIPVVQAFLRELRRNELLAV